MGLTDKHLVYGDDIPQTQMEKDYFWQVSKLKGEVMEERILKLEAKYERLENLLNALVSKITMDKAYADADIAGVRKATSDITPYTDTKTGYYGESEKVFYDAPVGNTSVFFTDYNGAYSVNRIQNRLIVSFDTLKEATDITISIL